MVAAYFWLDLLVGALVATGFVGLSTDSLPTARPALVTCRSVVRPLLLQQLPAPCPCARGGLGVPRRPARSRARAGPRGPARRRRARVVRPRLHVLPARRTPVPDDSVTPRAARCTSSPEFPPPCDADPDARDRRAPDLTAA